MLVLIVGFIVALVVGYRRGAISGPTVVGIAAISLMLGILGVVGNAAYNPWAGPPSLIRFAAAFLMNFVPLFGGFALGAIAKKQRLKNDAEADGTA